MISLSDQRWYAGVAVALLVAVSGCGDDRDREPTAVRADVAGPAARPRLGEKVFPLEAAPALEHPSRDAWQRPAEVVAALRLRPGDRVADVGCGTGYFTVRLLDAVAPAAADGAGAVGHVIAVDIQQGMLDILDERLTPAGRAHVTLRCSAPTMPLRSEDALDLVFCANTLKEVPDDDAATFVASLAAGLAPGGRLAILDWLPKPTGVGPPLAHRISPQRIRALAEATGLEPAQDLELLPTHSFLIFRKPRAR